MLIQNDIIENLIPENLKAGITCLGVTGTLESNSTSGNYFNNNSYFETINSSNDMYSQTKTTLSNTGYEAILVNRFSLSNLYPQLIDNMTYTISSMMDGTSTSVKANGSDYGTILDVGMYVYHCKESSGSSDLYACCPYLVVTDKEKSVGSWLVGGDEYLKFYDKEGNSIIGSNNCYSAFSVDMVIDNVLYAAGPGNGCSPLTQEVYFKLIDAIMTGNLEKIEIYRMI